MTPFRFPPVREGLRPYVWPLIILISALAAVVSAELHLSPPIQSMTLFWFVLVCPGMAFVRLLRLDDLYLEWTAAVALSIALGVAVTQMLLVTGHWSPTVGLATLACLAVLGASMEVIHVARLTRNGRCH